MAKNEDNNQQTNQGSRAWYVLRAISGKETKVKEVLEAQMKNTDLGNSLFQVLIPTEKVVAVKNGKKTTKERNLYSGYVFIEANLTGDIEYLLRNTSNVIDFLRGYGQNARPQKLRENEVLRMLGTADDINERAEEGVNDYMVGEKIKVVSGPFNGFNGEITEVFPERKKMRVLVKIFGRGSTLELENSQVERV